MYLRGYCRTTGCLKKTHLKEMCDLLTLKMLPLTLALIKTKNRHLFDPLVRKCLEFFNGLRQFSIEKGHFYKWVKKMVIFFLINTIANGKFLGSRNTRKKLILLFFRDFHERYCNVSSNQT